MKRNDYINATKKISKFLVNKDILSAFEYGSYKNPGLSDIDLFIIIKNKKYNSLNKIIDNFKKKELKFFFEYSTIMISGENFLQNILLFDDLKLKNIFGKKIKIKNFRSYDKELKLLSIIEWLPERTLRLKENLDNFKKIDLRQHLGLLNSLKYTLKKIDDYLTESSIKFYCAKIDLMRNDKKILKKNDEIFYFSKKIFTLSQKLIEKFAKISKIKSIDHQVGGQLIMKFPSKYKLIFSDKQISRLKKRSLKVPSIYSLPFAYYLKKKSILSNILNKHYNSSKNFRFKFKNKKINFILNKRNMLLSNNIKLLLKNNISQGIYKFGWYLR